MDLISLSKSTPAPAWGWGHSLAVPAESGAVARAAEKLWRNSRSAAVLFWDGLLGAPDPALVQELIASPVDCWHAGLKLGMGGLPGILNFITPTWMLTCDPAKQLEATSWRVSLRACLVKMEVLRKLGGPRTDFKTLDAAGLELGHRWICRGAIMRHLPALVEGRRPKTKEGGQPTSSVQLPFVDELRFAYYRHGRKWAGWASFRALMTRYATPQATFNAWRSVLSASRPVEPAPFRAMCAGDGSWKLEDGGQRTGASLTSDLGPLTSASSSRAEVSRPVVWSAANARVSVLIPTVDRYSYLRKLLAQLRHQTLPPWEIILVDQTADAQREPALYEEFRDLPLIVIYQAEPGQCASRNAGLQTASGDYVLFLDDDDEVPANLIESHLNTLAEFKAEISCGVADELGAGPLPADFRFLRASDVFPTNNTLIHREVLQRAGLFDLAYNHRQRADGDLGMRLYLAGATMILNPAISVLHHHAPAGGLRKHKARTVTYAMSRSRLFCRALASTSEFYLAGRYFSRGQVREMYWQTILGTFSLRSSLIKRAAKCCASAMLLPATLWALRSRMAQAAGMAAQFPQIPELASNPAAEHRLLKVERVI